MTSFYSPTSVHRAERCHNAEGMCREIPIGTIERYCGARQCFLSIEAKCVTLVTIITELESLNLQNATLVEYSTNWCDRRFLSAF